MAKTITEYQLFFAHPSDIVEEYEIASIVIEEWNRQHGIKLGARIQMTSWSTHSYPATGDRPQAIINKQVVDDADIVVGIFWSKFGSPTGKSDSGTEEEIRRSIKNQKKVMLYFSDRPLNPSKLNIEQYSKIQTFKNEFKDSGIYWLVNNSEDFETYFRQHLASLMNEFIGSDAKIKKSEQADKDGIQISVDLNSRYWVAILALLENEIGELPKLLEKLRRESKQPDDLNEGERVAVAYPLIARAKIVDALSEAGIMTQEAKNKAGIEALLKNTK